ncbi:MAG: DUF6684 family protein [Haloarculaceae archaeon]
MERELFDRDTLLDLVVNFIPLGIILFFVGVYLFKRPWGFDLGISGIMLALLIVPFLALGILTYVSAVAIAGDEQDKPVYAQGQAGLEGATPLHDDEEAASGADGETDHTDTDNESEDTDDESEGTAADDESADDEPSESEIDEEAAEHDDGDGADEGTAEATGEETADADDR